LLDGTLQRFNAYADFFRIDTPHVRNAPSLTYGNGRIKLGTESNGGF
jgi:hypothetical protein